MQAARLTFPEAPGQGARRGGWPAHSRSPLSARGGSSRGSGSKEVETRTRARIPGARGAPAPRPRGPARRHTARSRDSPSRSPSSESRYGVVEGGCGSTRSPRRLFNDACRGPRGSSPGNPEEESRDTGVTAAPAQPQQWRQHQQHTSNRQGDLSRRSSRHTGRDQRRVTACDPSRKRSSPVSD